VHGGEKRLQHIIAASRHLSRPETLFRIMDSDAFLSKREEENCHPIAKKWGFSCSAVTVKQDALYKRGYVLAHNQNALLRALLGPHARADILNALLNTRQQTISQLAAAVGLSYQPVHAEVEDLVRNGFATCQTWGRTRVISLTPAAAKFLKALPETMGVK